jgi:UDP:flavonoid glycosyltransferase YjiC (YdhE family)
MSRFLFVVPPMAGHINPTVAVGAELAARGHDVAWAGDPAPVRPLLADGARLFPMPGIEARHFPRPGEAFDARRHAERERRLPPRGPEALRFFWETFVIPLGHSMLPGVETAVARFKPDVVVADQQALAGPVAALRAGTAWATSATTPGELLGPLVGMSGVEEWVRAQMDAFQRGYGVTYPVDLRFSSQLVLVFTTGELIGDVSGFGDHFVFTGPALTARPDRAPFPWEWLDPGRRHVLVSLGTLNRAAGEEFFPVAVDALAGLGEELQAIIVTAWVPPRPVPPHILLAARVPQLALLPRLSAVVTHGGFNTVSEALAHGLPLLVAPIRDDQPLIAGQVVNAGAGLSVPFDGLGAAELRDALRAVLGDPRYAAGAQRIRDSFTAAGGAAAAARRLEQLA